MRCYDKVLFTYVTRISDYVTPNVRMAKLLLLGWLFNDADRIEIM
jgi:hypothetical protein